LTGAAVAVLLDDLTEQIGTDGEAQVVEIFFVSEAARHATALDVGGDHIKSNVHEQLHGRLGGADCLLLAMRVVEEAMPNFRL